MTAAEIGPSFAASAPLTAGLVGRLWGRVIGTGLKMRLGGRRFLLSLAIIGAAVCLALGISLPILRLTKFIFWTSEYSLISTVEVLLRDGQTFLGLVVLVFSILLPVVKLGLPAARLDAARSRAAPPRQAPQGHRVDRQMVHARRARAGADDLLPEKPRHL